MSREQRIESLRDWQYIISKLYRDCKRLDVSVEDVIEGLDEERYQMIKDTISILMESDFSKLPTKIYLCNYGIAYEGIRHILSRDYGIQLVVGSVKKQIYGDRDKMKKIFGNRYFNELTTYTEASLTEYNRRIHKLELYKVMDNIIIEFNCDECSSDDILVTKEEMTKFVKEITPYTKKYVNQLKESLGSNVINYVYGLEHKKVLSDTDMENIKILKSLVD